MEFPGYTGKKGHMKRELCEHIYTQIIMNRVHLLRSLNNIVYNINVLESLGFMHSFFSIYTHRKKKCTNRTNIQYAHVHNMLPGQQYYGASSLTVDTKLIQSYLG